MTFRLPSLTLGAAALILATGLGAAALSAQNTSQPPAPPHGRGQMGPGGPGMPGGPGGPLAMFLGRAGEQLGLTDVQKQQIKSIADAHKNDMQSVMKSVGDARRALLTAQVNGAGDDQVLAASAQVAKAEAAAAVAEAHIIAEVMQVLNADQQAQVKQFAQNPPPFGRGGRRGQ
jgi:Spy/CpxP family protein refolding chaperone